jgi:crossover junction endodeoxyribonuclease RusA
VTPKQDTRRGRPQTAAQQAFLNRLRDKGLGLAPVMADGRVVAPKRSSKQPASGGALRGRSVPQGSSDTLTRPKGSRPLASAIPGDTFELLIPAPAPFLNANQRLNRWDKAKRIKAWRQAAAAESARQGMPQGLPRVQIDAYVIKPVANRYDPANYADTSKATTDGLIDAGLAEDDNRKIVTGPFMHDGGKGSNSLRVVVTVLEAT